MKLFILTAVLAVAAGGYANNSYAWTQDDRKQETPKQDDDKKDGDQEVPCKDGKKGSGYCDGEQEEPGAATALFNVACYYEKHAVYEGLDGQQKDKDGDQEEGDQEEGDQEEGDQEDKRDGHHGDRKGGHKGGHDHWKKPQTCKAVAIFEKVVTLDGGEVADHSPVASTPLSPQIPRLTVECDNETKYNDHARRFTDLLSTRIQGLSGPFPAIYLPRGALHTGQHVSDSYLEIDSGIPTNRAIRMPGKCYVWTGAPAPELQ